jgi:hypothetical protein
VETTPARSGVLGGAGATLIVLGALWFAVGAVLLVLALLYGGGPEALPAGIDVDPNLFGAAPRAATLGFIAVVAGVGQLLVGYRLTRTADPWVVRLALAMAALAAALVAYWLVSGVAAGRPAIILTPPLVAYLYVAWTSVRHG